MPEGTVISMQMDRGLSSKTSRVGDRFSATVTTPVYVNRQVVIPAGTIVEGRVTQVTPAKRMSRSGTIAIDFDELVFPDGSRVGLVGTLTSDDPATRSQIDDENEVAGGRNKRAAIFIGGGGVIGAVIGGMAGGGKGAVIGGVAGAGAGVAAVLLSKGEEAEVPEGTPFGIQLQQPLVISEDDSGAGATGRDPSPPPQRTDPTRDISEPPRRATRAPQPQPDPSTNDTEVPRSPAPEPEPLPLSSPEMISRAQTALKEQGYYEGAVDGVMSARTSAALRTFQREHRLPETGDLDPATAKALGITTAAARPSPPPSSGGVPAPTTRAVDRQPAPTVSLQRQAEDLLAEYQRHIGVRPTGSGIEVDSGRRVGEAEMELLFAMDSFSNAAQLYARIAGSVRDQDSLRGAALALAREARRTDRVITTTSMQVPDALVARWDAIRQEVLKMMRVYNISSAELDH
ncbi:MAG TPA: peptidoglycan-binding protein [Blastocatellia bacterium]|nr:peptidoglycan-binding protein [Blastocatellia bacterium]